MTETLTQLETAALDEARDAYVQAVRIAKAARELSEFLTGLHSEFPDVDRCEMGSEAGTERKAQIVDRMLLAALEMHVELSSVAHKAPEQMVTWSKAAIEELKAARDCLAPWRTAVAA